MELFTPLFHSEQINAFRLDTTFAHLKHQTRTRGQNEWRNGKISPSHPRWRPRVILGGNNAGSNEVVTKWIRCDSDSRAKNGCHCSVIADDVEGDRSVLIDFQTVHRQDVMQNSDRIIMTSLEWWKAKKEQVYTGISRSELWRWLTKQMGGEEKTNKIVYLKSRARSSSEREREYMYTRSGGRCVKYSDKNYGDEI